MKIFTKKVKYGTMLLYLIILIPLLGFSQTHFTPAVNNGTGNWHIYPVHATIDGIPLVAGDEIALFDGNVCVGARVLTAALDGSYGLATGNDWISYEKSNSGAGYTGGNSYTWKCWDASAGEYVGTMTYNTTYSPQDYVGSVFPGTMTYRWSWVDLAFTTVAPAAGDISGTITNSVGGAPISGVSVTATGSATFTTSTNGSGVYLFDNIPPDTYTISTSHANYVAQSSVDVLADGDNDVVNFSLVYKTGTLSGFVYDGTSAPVVGASVQITGGPAAVLSGALGAYTVTGVAPGTYSVVASKAGFASTTETGVVINPNATTNKNITIYAAGTLSGVVKDGSGATLNGVTVSVVGTATTAVTAGGGLFSFPLNTGTYSLTFEKSGFHSSSSTGLAVTAGNTTTANKTLYAINWTFNDGDPFSDVWTIYLNTVTGDGTALKAGDEISVWAPLKRANISAYAPFESGSILSIAAEATGSITAFDALSGEGGEITSVVDGSPNAQFNSSSLPSISDVVDIFGTTSYNITSSIVSAVGGGYFETGIAFVFDETGSWVLNSNSTTTVTSNSHGLSNGNSIQIIGGTYAGTYTISNVTVNTFDIPVKWAGTETATWSKNTTSIVTTSVAHGLSNGDNITITGTTSYNGTYSITNASGSTFGIAHVFGTTETGAWANKAATKVTSTAHGRTNGESIKISGSTNYNGTYTVANASTNTFEIAHAFIADDATGKWVFGEQMVGLYYLPGPINNAGTAHALKAFSVLNDASTGYQSGETYVFKLSYGGGSVLTALNSTTWTPNGGGLVNPGTTIPSGSVFSKVNLDFDLPPGSLSVDFVDEGSADPDSPLYLTLKKGGIAVGSTITWTGPAAYTYSSLDAGTYTLTVTSDRFETTTYIDINVAPSTLTTKNYVINHFANQTQTINLHSGYQLISRRVGNDSYDMSTYLAGTMAPTAPVLTKLDMTKDEDGNSDTYIGGVVTDGGVQWAIKRAYNFKNNASDVMQITSRPIAANATIQVRATAFSMISYLPDYTLDAEVAFASLMTTDLDFIRDGAGNSLTKVDGVWVDHIGNCTAGQGYLIKWNGILTNFNYPAETKSVETSNSNVELVHFPFYSGYGNPMSNTYTMYVSGTDLEVGDEVAAFDGTNIVGATVINSSNALDNNLNTFAELFDKQGFVSGNPIVLKLWKASEDKEYWLNFTNVSESDNMYKGVVYPNSDGMKSIVNVALSPEGINDKLAQLISVYPNPTSSNVTISSPEQIDRIILVNIMGQTLIDLKPLSGNTELNLEGYNPGVYFINLIIDGTKVTKKVTIQ